MSTRLVHAQNKQNTCAHQGLKQHTTYNRQKVETTQYPLIDDA